MLSEISEQMGTQGVSGDLAVKNPLRIRGRCRAAGMKNRRHENLTFTERVIDEVGD